MLGKESCECSRGSILLLVETLKFGPFGVDTVRGEVGWVRIRVRGWLGLERKKGDGMERAEQR